MTNTTWDMRRVMRIAHPKNVDPAVGDFILNRNIREDAPAILQGFKAMQAATSVDDVLAVLAEHRNLPWETIPTQFLKDKRVWERLFDNNALNGQALVRNVTRLARMDAFNDMQFAARYAERLSDEQMIARTRLHPLNYLNALVVHTDGQLQRGAHANYYWVGSRNKDWTTNSVIAGALEEGFYKAFKYVEPAGKSTLLALDVSGSMGVPAMGLDLSCAQVAAAMAMTIARTEPAHQIMGFSTSFVDLGITKNDSLESVLRKTNRSFGGTDTAQPMVWALEKRVEVEHFCVITDNETWAGRHGHAVQALDRYKKTMGVDSRSSAVALSSTGFTIADPNRSDMMDLVGGDANLPRLLTEFASGRL